MKFSVPELAKLFSASFFKADKSVFSSKDEDADSILLSSSFSSALISPSDAEISSKYFRINSLLLSDNSEQIDKL